MARARRWSFHSMKPRVAIALIAWLILLFIIGGYAVSLTFTDGLNLRAVRTLHERLYQPTADLVTALEAERRASAELVSSDGRSGDAVLDAAREHSVQAADTFRAVASDPDIRAAEGLGGHLDAVVERLSGLDTGRQNIDAGRITRTQVLGLFNGVIDGTFPVLSAMPANDHAVVGDRHLALIELLRSRELLAREDGLLAGALAGGALHAVDRDEFTRLVGARRFLAGEIELSLLEDQRARYRRVLASDAFATLRGMEDKLTSAASGQTAPFSAAAWTAATKETIAQLTTLETAYATEMLKRSDAEATSVLWRGAITVLLGLLLVTALMTVWLRVAPRHVLGQLNGLKQAALQLAHERLPRVVGKLQRGERVDVDAEAPPLEFGPDEFGDVGRAFNAVQQTAVQAAVDQAVLRHGVKEVFVNLARRSQGLVHRQLTMLDEMERRTTDPDELERLFAIDHLATRMRRHAEDLIILSGSPPGRRWRKPVPLVDVVRAAVGEVESYSRVAILPVPQAALAGRVVADVIHLLAELIENATSLSPPHTKVQVSSQLVPSGFVVEIEDRGLGMSDADLFQYNQRLASPPEFNLSDTVRLGLFVVGRLAERHDIKVHLRRSPYGGTTAIVLIPAALVVTADAIEYDDTDPLESTLTHTMVPASIRATPEPARLAPDQIRAVPERVMPESITGELTSSAATSSPVRLRDTRPADALRDARAADA
ncbi:MAG: sensor histidine kinase, partial [Micromonosporaceae bacterium]